MYFELNGCRNQTEEWKGWMQVMFVWYHYFAAKEWYNLIRVYIGCYVWMTGFGQLLQFVSVKINGVEIHVKLKRFTTQIDYCNCTCI